ncbi:permease prefix domain 1-containing protein, partial [Escherichia coli]|uniref:permease prefix domain 1-containing protein n=1 Tax=Escherichia coli TaxID=562 RepID=UPI001CCF1E1C
MYEELLSHLECSFIDYQKQGLSEEEAMRTAMTNFGEEREIGKQLQQAMYPYRREMMLSLSVASLLFAYSVYACQLFVMGDAHIPWLIVAVFIST